MAELVLAGMYQLAIMGTNTYFESWGEPHEGMIAVNQVVIQRMFERNMSAEQVIKQRFQFSWLWDNKPDVIGDMDKLAECFVAVKEAWDRRTLGDNFHHANLYHAVSVHPSWADDPRVKKIAEIGNHIFYREPWKTSNHWTLAHNELP